MSSHSHEPVPYTAAQAARLAGCTVSQLEAWRRVGLVTPDPREATYAFRDLVALRMVTALLAEGVPTRRIRRAVDALLDAGDDIASLSLVSDGDAVLACRDDGQVLDALRNGQLALFVSVGRLARDVDAEVRVFAADRATFVDAISAPG
ncbi:MAG: helix-turn-helix domain-containing protein [Acidimicrobiia bacterium]